MKLTFSGLLLLLVFKQAFCQEDFSWWEKIHHWDGHTSWVQYMTMSTSFMGPNSLPVPKAMNGLVDSSAEIEVAGNYHFSEGDKTKDFYTRGYLPLFDHRMAVSLDVVPYEWFSTDTITRDIRSARTRSGKGGAGGDIYLYTDFQLVRNHTHIPDLLFQVCFRTASGTNLRNARFTDGPGYFFNLSCGKNYHVKNIWLRPYLMIGFYAYQTFDLQHLQNDCFLYGGGIELSNNKIVLAESISGYDGYLQIGDKPLVYRSSLRIKNQHLDWKISYEWGLNDFPFQTIAAGVIYHFNAALLQQH